MNKILPKPLMLSIAMVLLLAISSVAQRVLSGEAPSVKGSQTEQIVLKSANELVKSGDNVFLSNYSLEDQFYKQKDYASSIVPWRVLYNIYPKSTVRIYQHGRTLFLDKFEKSSNWTEKGNYIDSLMSVYEKRIEYFGNKGYVRGFQGTDYTDLVLRNENWNNDQLKVVLKRAYGYLEESLNLQGDSASAPVMLLLMQTTSKLFKLGEMPKDNVVENYEQCSSILDKCITRNPKDQTCIDTKGYVIKIFETSGAADCETLLKLYGSKFAEIEKDIAALKKMLRLLDKQNCTGSDLYAKASEKLVELEPSPEAAFNMGRICMKRGDFERGKSFYLKAIEAEQDKEKLSKYYYELGYSLLTKEQNFQEARNYVAQLLANNPNYGKAYLLLGDIYAGYSSRYGKNDFEHRSLYWLAVDYFMKAKRIDPEMANLANEKIATYSPHFPDKEAIFFETLKEGDSYTISSWINETTTVRAKK